MSRILGRTEGKSYLQCYWKKLFELYNCNGINRDSCYSPSRTENILQDPLTSSTVSLQQRETKLVAFPKTGTVKIFPLKPNYE